MAANFFFDKMVPAPPHELPKKPSRGERQLEVFAHSGQLYLRVGPLGEENSGEQWTVMLSEADSAELEDGLSRARAYLSWGRR